MRTILLVIVLSSFALAKDTVKVEIKAVHAATREARDTRALVEKGIIGAGAPNRSVEVYNLDTIINGDKTVLACDDNKGCESPSLGTYDGELKRGHVKLMFELPVSHKKVSHWYKIAGSWQ